MKWKTMDEFAQMVVDKAINEIECNGKTLREWIEIISATELGTNLAEVGTDVPDTNVGDKAQLSDKGTTFENGGEIKRWSKDIISRQVAIDAIEAEKTKRGDYLTSSYVGYEIAEKVVAKLPPAEPKRGKWIDGIIPNDSGGLPVIVCDQCNTFFPLQFGDGHNFCPNCGADMRGEQDVRTLA